MFQEFAAEVKVVEAYAMILPATLPVTSPEVHHAVIVSRREFRDRRSWERIRKRVEDIELCGAGLFECEEYAVYITRGEIVRDERGTPYSTMRNHMVCKSTGSSWTVSRIGSCRESLFYLAHAEWKRRLSDTIENFLQEIAQEVSEVTGGLIEAWCRSRPDVVQMFREERLGKRVCFPTIYGTREPVGFGSDERVFGNDAYQSDEFDEKRFSDTGS